MTTLTDPLIADVCRKAGFTGDYLTDAVALALATSGGIPGYDHMVTPGPVAHYKGLFGVDTIRWPNVDALDLHSPYIAADVAYAMTKRHGWGWSAVARAGVHPRYQPRAVAAAALTPYREIASEPIMVHQYRHATERQHAQIFADMAAIDYGGH